MAKSIGREAEAFARLLLQTVERLAAGGGWVRARAALDQTVAAHPHHPYVASIEAKPARRIGLSAVAERIRAAEFPHLERRKAGLRRNAPVFYRIGRPVVELELNLPFLTPASHPLVTRHRASDAASGGSARRAALIDPPAKAPWRRRLLRRPVVEAGPVRRWWTRLYTIVTAIAAAATRRATQRGR